MGLRAVCFLAIGCFRTRICFIKGLKRHLYEAEVRDVVNGFCDRGCGPSQHLAGNIVHDVEKKHVLRICKVRVGSDVFDGVKWEVGLGRSAGLSGLFPHVLVVELGLLFSAEKADGLLL